LIKIALIFVHETSDYIQINPLFSTRDLQNSGSVLQPVLARVLEEETAHHIVCECPAIKSIRVRLYGEPLLLPEEVMEEPLWKKARFASETGLLTRKPGLYNGPNLSA